MRKKNNGERKEKSEIQRNELTAWKSHPNRKLCTVYLNAVKFSALNTNVDDHYSKVAGSTANCSHIFVTTVRLQITIENSSIENATIMTLLGFKHGPKIIITMLLLSTTHIYMFAFIFKISTPFRLTLDKSKKNTIVAKFHTSEIELNHFRWVHSEYFIAKMQKKKWIEMWVAHKLHILHQS